MTTLAPQLLSPSIDINTMSLLIVGKGPSAKKIKFNKEIIQIGDKNYQTPPKLETASLNHAWQLFESPVDYGFMGDYINFEELKQHDIKIVKNSIKRLVKPTFPLVYPHQQQVNNGSGCLPAHIDYHYKDEQMSSIIDEIPYYLIQVENSPFINYGVETYPEISNSVSIGNIAVSFGLSRGFKHFILSGFDPEPEGEVYSDFYKYAKKKIDSNSFNHYYQFSYAKMIEKIISSGCSYQRI